MPWVVEELTFGWPPNVKIRRVPGDEKPLHALFTAIEDRHLLTHGYGTRAGIDSVEVLARRVDDLRDELRPALKALSPRGESAVWIRKLSKACDELLGHAYKAMAASPETRTDSEITPAVRQLQDAFRVTADHVGAIYRLPAAKNLAHQIERDLADSADVPDR
jgi:hypothetical protein